MSNNSSNNNKNKFLVFSHEQDVDGIFSAAILRTVHPDCEVVLTNYGFQNMVAIRNKILSFIQSKYNDGANYNNGSSNNSEDKSNNISDNANNHGSGTIVIADIGVNEESYRPVYEALDISKKRGYTNIWIDH